MQQKTIDPNQLSDIELKAMVYDMSVQIQSLNNTISVVNDLLKKRSMEAATGVADTPKVEQVEEQAG